MDFQEAIRRIEERGDYNRYAEVKPVFEEELKKLPEDSYAERAVCFYYLLASYLKAQLVHETQESIEFYKKMDAAFLAQEKFYKKHSKGISSAEIEDFYELVERCYGALEFLYERHHFIIRRNEAYEQKMGFRKNAYRYKKQIPRYLEYKLLELTSRYGISLGRWAISTLVFTFIFAVVYYAIDFFQPVRMVQEGTGNLFDYFYFSMVATTTLGLGDIVPISLLGKALVALQGFAGFLMLGVFVGMLQRKF